MSCYSNKIESVGLRKCPRDRWLNYQQSVFKRCHSDKYFSEFLPIRRRQRSTGIDMEQNYVTVTLCILNQTRHLTGAEAEEDTCIWNGTEESRDHAEATRGRETVKIYPRHNWISATATEIAKRLVCVTDLTQDQKNTTNTWRDVTESIATIQSPFYGYNMA